MTTGGIGAGGSVGDCSRFQVERPNVPGALATPPIADSRRASGSYRAGAGLSKERTARIRLRERAPCIDVRRPRLVRVDESLTLARLHCLLTPKKLRLLVLQALPSLSSLLVGDTGWGGGGGGGAPGTVGS